MRGQAPWQLRRGCNTPHHTPNRQHTTTTKKNKIWPVECVVCAFMKNDEFSAAAPAADADQTMYQLNPIMQAEASVVVLVRGFLFCSLASHAQSGN